MNSIRNLALAALAAVSFTAAVTPAAAQMNGNSPEKIEFAIDVAEDMGKFNWTPVTAGDEEPKRGSFFVTEGNIYPAGTIPGNGADFDPNLPGSLGTWFCKGTFLVAASQMDKSAMAVLTDQVYLMPDHFKSIATTGTEGNGLAVRTVMGGTGPYAGYVGEQRQQFLGFNKTGGVNFRVTFKLRKSTNF